jgi:Protein of unknown function (DUF3347)
MKQIVAILFFAACLSCQSGTTVDNQPVAALKVKGESVNTAVFNSAFKSCLGQYYALKDAFIDEKMPDIDSAANDLQKAIQSLPLNELKSDTAQKAANILIESIVSELKGLAGETDIEEKRKAFQMIGEQFLVLIAKVQYDHEIIYNQYCPMAMDNNGASWLSQSADIKNPYLPKTMLECGEVKDTLNFVAN